jgi:hypothetical protein
MNDYDGYLVSDNVGTLWTYSTGVTSRIIRVSTLTNTIPSWNII